MRSQRDHLSPHELVSLTDSREALAAGGPFQQELSQHLQQCEACSSLAHTHWSIRSQCGSAPSAKDEEPCFSQTVWLEFAAGQRSEETLALLSHTSSCATCARALKEAMQLMQSDELAEDHAEPFTGLASATPAWQRSVAQRMAVASVPSSRTDVPATTRLRLVPRSLLAPLRHSRPLIILPAVAAFLGAAVLTGLQIWRSTHPSDAHLLALAYNKQRTLVLRIPGAEPVPMASVTRSANGANHGLAESAELLELHLRAQQHLDQDPRSPYWHQVLGEIDLLQQDGLAARRNFEIAQATDANLPNLLPDLAAAWFELGDSTSTSVDYARAAELYLRELGNLGDHRSHATGPALLHYNLALCWERQNLAENALSDLRAALAIESSPAWRKVIQSEIDHLSAHSSTPPPANAAPANDYETDLTDATANLLPRWWDDPAVHARILQTASLGLRHHDRWLSDWISAPHTPASRQADNHLAASIRAAIGGDSETSLGEANRAFALYAHVRNSSGLLRAEYAQTYAYQRLGRTRECIASAATIDNDPRFKEYALFRARALLDRSICSTRDGDFATARHAVDQVLSLTALSSLPLLQLYAISMRAAIFHDAGETSTAWQIDASGLLLCAQANCPSTRRYAFFYDMVRNAQDLGLFLTAASLMHAAVSIAASSTDMVTRAYALETMGRLAGRIGDFTASAQAFAEASQIARSGNRAAMSAIYQAEWQIDQAEVLSRQGHAQAALNLLQQSQSVMLTGDYVPGRIKFFRQSSIAQLQLRRYEDALATALAAVHEAERSLPNLRSIVAKEKWMRESVPIYTQLIKVYLGRNDQASALRTWESFRNAAYAPASIKSLLPGETHADTAIIILARVDDVYIGWLATPDLRALRTSTLGDSTHLQQSTATFYRLCADRDSSLADIRALGAQLFAALLLPLTSQLPPGSHHIFVDLDPSLAMLPLAALTPPGGSWLADSLEITVLPAWWSLDPASAIHFPSISPAMHMVVVQGFSPSSGETSEAVEVAKLFHPATVIDSASTTPDSIKSILSAAEIFHFSGHGTGQSGALLAADPNAPPVLTPESLQGVHLARCRVAVLAACNTTSADPDQIEKLPDMRTALLLSGAHTVVASNWDVDDRSTRSLMLAFYKQLASGLSPSLSLQTAQQSIRSAPGWQHPFYWAPFELFTN